MSVPPRLSMLTLGVSDLRRSTDFYTRLGWRLSQRASSPAISFFELGKLVLALYQLDDLRMDAGADAATFGGQVLSQNQAAPADVDAAVLAAVNSGGVLQKAPRIASWGGYHGVVADPDGHSWEFAHNPFFPLAADGSLVLPP